MAQNFYRNLNLMFFNFIIGVFQMIEEFFWEFSKNSEQNFGQNKADGHNLKSFNFFRSLGWSWRICDQGKRHIWSNVWQRLSIIDPKMETHSNSNWSTQDNKLKIIFKSGLFNFVRIFLSAFFINIWQINQT